MSRRWPAAAIVTAVVASILFGGSAASADAVRDDQYWLDGYGIRAAWATTQGAGVTIAIIDTGVDGSVPELAGAVIGGTDFSGLGSINGQKPVGTEGPEHGTMVASLAAGRGTNATDGVIGAAPMSHATGSPAHRCCRRSPRIRWRAPAGWRSVGQCGPVPGANPGYARR